MVNYTIKYSYKLPELGEFKTDADNVEEAREWAPADIKSVFPLYEDIEVLDVVANV